MIIDIINRWELLRKQSGLLNRTEQCNIITDTLRTDISAIIKDYSAGIPFPKDVPSTFAEFEAYTQHTSSGKQLVSLLTLEIMCQYYEHLLSSWSVWINPDTIICVINCLDSNHSLYIQNIARGVLMLIFKTPWITNFSGQQLLVLYNHMYNNVPAPLADSDAGKREKFMLTVGRFFDEAFYLMQPEMINGLPTVDNLRGSLLGMALGDALGFLVEGFSREKTHEYVKNVIRTGTVSEYGLHVQFGHSGQSRYCKISSTSKQEIAYKFGQYTDDTQCCRELLMSIVEGNGKFDEKLYAKRLVSLFGNAGLLRSDTQFESCTTSIVGYGTTTRDSVQRLADGIPWNLAGSYSTQGNGGCMRVAPLGVLYYTNPDYLIKVASEQCLGTHGSSRSKASAVMIAVATRIACQYKLVAYAQHDLTRYNYAFCKRIEEAVYRYDKEVALAVMNIPDWLSERRQNAWEFGDVYANNYLVERITELAQTLGDKFWHDGKAISSYAIQTSLFAVCCFLSHPTSYMDAVCMAISAGGDTDTTAAITGAISGAYLGADALPMDLLQHVNDNGTWVFSDLDNLCYKLTGQF